MQIRSLHTQVNIVLVILTITLLIQVYSAHYSLSTLIVNQYTLSQYHHNVGVVYELERDVIDLQRNLLIYKETGSVSSTERFHSVIKNINLGIKDLSDDVGDGDLYLVNHDMFSRMVSHIKDYETNFSSVVNAKLQKETSFNTIKNKLDELLLIIKSEDSSDFVEFQEYMAKLNQAVTEYIISLDPEEINKFNTVFSELNKKIILMDDKDIVAGMNLIKKEFRRLIQVNRGYLYLVNVVMAGSANEFLFLTKKIRESAIVRQSEIEHLADKSSKYAQFINGLVNSIFMLIILTMAWFLSRKILLPIKNITDVFNTLSRGDEVDVIPSTYRMDEIGNLARAAQIFHENNKLTQALLVESQDMIANQAVMNIELEQEKKKAVMAAESKSMFLANMSHEIRTPMNGIVGLVDLVLKTELTNKQKRYLDRIAYSGQIMMNVINDILDFSKIEAGKMEIESVDFDKNNVIENLISSMIVRVNDKSLDFKIWVTPRVPKILIGDPLRISQILLNLCSNSIKFTDQGSISIKFDFLDNKFCFSVHDTGIGMSEKQVSSIFESFTQADGSISRKYGGTGLGLTIVEQLVKLMDGDIRVESSVGSGTDIYVNVGCEILNDEPLLNRFEDTLPVIYYIGRDGESSDMIAVLDAFNVNVENISKHRNDPDYICGLPENNFIIFEGVSSLDSTIQKRCKDLNIKLFCILNSNEIEDKNTLKKLGLVEVLQHPFSPKQIEIFLKTLLTLVDVKAESVRVPHDENYLISGHVLLVEDNEINQLVAGDMLEGLGVTFDLAEDGSQAVTAIQHKHYDLVFMDVQMPVMDGYSATRAVRDAGIHDVIICGLSANALKEDIERAEQSGMNDYLTKPLKQHSLKAMLEKYLRKPKV